MAASKTIELRDSALYDQDFFAWIEENVSLLRQRRLSEVDLAHLADELEDMGKREQRELASRLGILLAHLLKWQYQPERRGASWINTIAEQRLQLEGLLEQSPSLRSQLSVRVERAYSYAVQVAVRETGTQRSPYPAQCPYIVEQILDPDFWPGD